MSDEAKVDTPIAAYLDMAEAWVLPDDLLGGTRRMRAKATQWLPKEDQEQDGPYQRRLGRSYLLGAYSDGVSRLSTRPFSRPVTIKGELPDALKHLLTNADGQGSDLTTYAQTWIREAIHRGVAHTLVDMPRNPERRLAADPDAPRDLLPYFRLLSGRDLIGWRGHPRLEQIRFRACRTAADGEWGEERIEQIYVVEPFSVAIYEKRAAQKDFPATAVDVVTTTIDDVPLARLNLKSTGPMTAIPPLEELAWLNLEHWQSKSDQNNCLRFARLAMLFFSGVTDEEAKAITPGPSGLFTARDPAANGRFIEHGGQAIGLGRQSLQDVEAQMAILAMQPLMQQTGNPTATGKAIDEANVQSALHAWVRLLEHAIEQAFRYAADYVGVALPIDFAVDVFDDFGLDVRALDEVRALIDARRAGLISSRTFLTEFKRRGLIGDTTSVQDELDEIALEPPPMAGGIFGAPPLAPPQQPPAAA